MEEILQFIKHICIIKKFDYQKIINHLEKSIDLPLDINEIDISEKINDTSKIYVQTPAGIKFYKEIKIY